MLRLWIATGLLIGTLALAGCQTSQEAGEGLSNSGARILNGTGKVLKGVFDGTGKIIEGVGREVGAVFTGTGRAMEGAGEEIGGSNP